MFYKLLSHFSPVANFREDLQIKIPDLVCLITAIATILFSFAGRDSIQYCIYMIVLSIIFLTGIILNYLEKYKFAAHFIAILTTIWITTAAVMFGGGVGIQHYMVIILMCFCIYLPRGSYRMFSIVFILVLIVGIRVYQKNYAGMYVPADAEYIYGINVFLPYLIVALICMNLVKQALTYQAVIERQKEVLLDAVKFNDKIFSIIGHDMRAPFISTQNMISLLEDDALNANEKAEFFGQLKSSINASLQTLDNLLKWASKKSQTADYSVRYEQFDLTEIIKQVIDFYHDTALQKNILFINSIVTTYYAFGDVNEVAFILRNLTSNALKFSFSGQTIEFELTQAEDNFIVIGIKDQGIGMSENTINRLFDITTRFSTKGTAKETGTGLGLLFCKEFIENNNGKIRIESKLDKGTSIFFTLKGVSSNIF
ncbi:HAMP domain-containing sensor histidine kinase [Pedobacter sp. UYP1]|uniref:sensor histidine kinase n=1 Tax=Pedobacter sp. UYP1 TaxID=1756396 RepID=UPI0033941CBB